MKLSFRAISTLGLTLTFALSACSQQSEGEEMPSLLTQPALAATPASIRDVSVEQADALIRSEAAVVVLDVRTPAEFAQGHIEGAVNIDAMSESFVEDLAALDKDAAYVVHCRSGKRSAKAIEAMRAASFKDIAHMNAGLNGWNEAELPIAP